MPRSILPAATLALSIALGSPLALAQDQGGFEKKNFSYNEWTKGKFSEVVTVTNPGKVIFLAGIGPEREGDGKIVHEGDFTEQCRYAYMKIKKLLALQGATMHDVVRIVTYITDIRFFRETPASTLLNVPQLAWPYMMIEVDVTAMLAK